VQNDLQKDLEEMFELPLSDECLTQQNEAYLEQDVRNESEFLL
jgi:hypothetical protein